MVLHVNMEALLSSSAAAAAAAVAAFPTISAKPPPNTHCKISPLTLSFPARTAQRNLISSNSSFSSSVSRTVRAGIGSTTSSPTSQLGKFSSGGENRHWMVVVEAPPRELIVRSQIIDYYVRIVRSVLDRWAVLVFFA